jgi:transcriptional regulator with XRE-family HTH domain
MSSLRRQVGTKVRHYRERADLTQTELGDLIGKSLETIGRIERGTTAPSLALLEKLAEALKVDSRDLLGTGSHAAKTRKTDPLAQLIDRLAGLSDEDLARADKLLAVAMDWKNSK